MRKESNQGRTHLMASASTATSGLRPPQTYPIRTTHHDAASPMTASATSNFTSRLPQPQFNSPDPTRAGTRRPSVISIGSPSPITKRNLAVHERPARTRTMSDASRYDMPPSTPVKTRKSDLRRPVMPSNQPSDSSDDSDNPSAQHRASAPLLNAYGMPVSRLMKPRKSVGNMRFTGNSASAPWSEPLPSDLNQKIRVCVRKRPLNKKELERGEKDTAPTLSSQTIQINEPKQKLDLTRYIEQHTFTFDDVFDSDVSNTVLYQRTALPLVDYIFKGGKATCFAYGQTGSGKTYTMLDPRKGLYVLAARDIFSRLHNEENRHLSAWIGLYEIYQGQLYDLLNERKRLHAREDGKRNVIVAGLREYPIDNVDELIRVFEYGCQIRSTGSTGANDTSSRSHAVLQILLKPVSNRKQIHGKLSFIDLAGSERGVDRGDTDTKTRMEGAEINKSLLALKECIRALDQDKRHTPFRQSKLTQVLKDSFVGKSRTCMIATISPSGSNSEHTLNTLRYADRVKELKGERARVESKQPVEEDAPWMMMDISQTDDLAVGEDMEADSIFSADSDILDEDTLNAEEEDIFNVDFPHEQDALIESSAFAAPSAPSSNKISWTDSWNTDIPATQPARPLYASSHSPPADAADDLSFPAFDCGKMDQFINLHRAQIRQVAECTKHETKLIGRMTLGMSSDLSFEDSSEEEDHDEDNIKTSRQFKDYLLDLQDVLEQKLAAIDVLRDHIHDTVSQLPM